MSNISSKDGGISWTSPVPTNSEFLIQLMEFTNIGYTVYFAILDVSGSFGFFSYDFGRTSSPNETVLHTGTPGQWATISTGGSTLVVSVAISLTMDDFYSTNLGGLWKSSTISSSEANIQQGTATQSIVNDQLGVVWASGSLSPFSVTFALVTLSQQTTSTTSTQSSSCSGPVSSTKNGVTITINSNCCSW